MSSDRSSERPSWSRSRRELVFTSAGVDYWRVLMVAPYLGENGSFHAGKAQLWAPRGLLRYVADDRFYALHPDGMRVAVARPAEDQSIAQRHVTFMLDFLEELRRIAPPKASR